MLHRIREAMKLEPLAGLLSGTVVADETWIGGKPGKMSNAKRPKRQRWDYGRTDKPAVLALVDAGPARSAHGASRTCAATPSARPSPSTSRWATTLVTDEAKGYELFRGEMKGHETVVHARRQYLRAGWTTNAAENIDGFLVEPEIT